MATSTGKCGKCGEANSYDTTVCAACGARLPWANALDTDRRQKIAAEQAAQEAAAALQAEQKQATKAAIAPRPGDMICSDCGYLGKPKKYSKFNILIGAALFCLGIFPALIYAIWCMMSDYSGCPQCAGKNMLPLHTPGGKELYAKYYS